MARDLPEHQADAPPHPHASEHVVVFRLADELYGIDIRSVQEIVRLQPITSIPGSEPWIVGITNLRGRIVPVIDLRRRCGLAVADHSGETRIIVVSGPEGMTGLLVDAVSDVLEIAHDQVEAPAGIVTSPENTYIRAIATLPGRLVSLMDLDRLLSLPANKEVPAGSDQAAA